MRRKVLHAFERRFALFEANGYRFPILIVNIINQYLETLCRSLQSTADTMLPTGVAGSGNRYR
jgi:hypothetical protein